MKKFKLPLLLTTLWLLLGQSLVCIFGGAFYELGCLIYWYGIKGFEGHPAIETIEMIVALIIFQVVVVHIARAVSIIFTITAAIASLAIWKKVKLDFFLLFTPISALLLWYGYDHFVPSYRLMNDARPPYQHGLTWARFGIAWLVETIIAIGYWLPLRKTKI